LQDEGVELTSFYQRGYFEAVGEFIRDEIWDHVPTFGTSADEKAKI
jgi:hypothetical protein